jgi:hypothetical protein
MNLLLQKKALDAWFEQINEPDYAEHQHHSDPSYTTQNGKDYAGRGTTENEEGALQDGIPAGLLSVELGKSADDDNPHVTPMPSAPAPVDPSNATFFKESEPNTPFTDAEEKINAATAGSGFHFVGRVTDGTTLWYRGKDERLSFNPKTGNVTHFRNGKVVSECPVDKLGRIKSAAIRPSPHTVFEDKVDNATGKQPIAPTEPSDNEVMQAQKTLENAGVGDQIGVNAASETVQIAELGTKMSGFTGGGPFSCMDCVHRTPHSKNAKGEEVDSCKHPDVMADPELADRKLPDGTIEVDADDCCRFVRPTKKESEKEAAVTKTYGTGTPPGGTPNDPSIDEEDADEGKTSSQKRADIGIKETPKHLPPRDDIRRHIDQDVQDEITDEVMEGVKDASEEGEYYLDKVNDMKAEAKEAFMNDGSMQQEAQDAGMGMEDLWKEIGGEFTENYYMSAYSKQGSIAVEEGFKCPNCKSMKGKAVDDGLDDTVSLRECLTCGSFY